MPKLLATIDYQGLEEKAQEILNNNTFGTNFEDNDDFNLPFSHEDRVYEPLDRSIQGGQLVDVLLGGRYNSSTDEMVRVYYNLNFDFLRTEHWKHGRLETLSVGPEPAGMGRILAQMFIVHDKATGEVLSVHTSRESALKAQARAKSMTVRVTEKQVFD